MAIDTKTSPLVILGFEVGDPDSIERWAREGALPTIASIMKRGCWGRTTGPELICGQGVGLSLFSGVSRSEHGYYYFRQLKPGTYDLQCISARDADTLPFWSHFRGREKKVAIIDAPDIYALDGIPGVQLANWATLQAKEARLPPSAEPAGVLHDVRQLIGQQIEIDGFRAESSFSEDQLAFRLLMKRIEKKGALCRYLLSRNSYDLVVAMFSETHVAGHRFWNYRPEAQPNGTATKKHTLANAIPDTYRAIDRQLGVLLEQVPNEANVVIISLFGMKDHYPTTGLIEAFCRQLGYQAPSEPTLRSLSPLALARWAMPQPWRTTLSHLLPEERRERLLADQFSSTTNWERTTAFAIPSLNTSFVWVNLRGREPAGVVEPGAEYGALLDRLEADLKRLVDPHTGDPAVEQVTRTVEAFGGAPPVSLPDLFVEWNAHAHFMQRIVHPRAELVQLKQRYHRGSYHSFSGFVAAAGPSIQGRGAVGSMSLLDLCPTFLSLMGEPVPPTMSGKVIGSIAGTDATNSR